jgi:hypothetical protein
MIKRRENMGGAKDEYEEGYADGRAQAEWSEKANSLESVWGHSERKSGKGPAYDKGYEKGKKDGKE